jgi:Raf kinase inhibitor-like YbhB/YbcL family protein
MTAVSPYVLMLTSPAFGHQQPIPRRYTCDGEDVSPPLSWTGVPQVAESLALRMDDPDAPGGVFTHWVYYNLPATLRDLPEDVDKTERPRAGGIQGLNDFGHIGYNGPCPPPGPPHHYHLTLYALDAVLTLPHRASKRQLLVAMADHVLRQAEIVGVYQRARGGRPA